MAIVSAGASAAAAAAAIARQRREEEEEMTPYGPGDLAEYEFKILRSQLKLFDKPEKFKEVLAEEAQAGWELVEKFDGGRVRLKRKLSWRAKDDTLGWDPYRTVVGISETKLVLIILGCVFGGLAMTGLIAALIANAR